MNSKLLGLLAETSLHFGAGSNEGSIDLPVAREAATGYPVLVGSSLKGAMRVKAKVEGKDINVEEIFGKPDGAGGIIVSDARLLLLPVRSLQSSYKWITCPLILERLGRDAQRCGLMDQLRLPASGTVAHNKYVGAGNGQLFLEEREFSYQSNLPQNLTAALGKLLGHANVASRLASQLVILHDDDFVWFAKYGLPVTARNKLNNNKTSENLWYEETLPPDSLLYTMLIGPQAGGDLNDAMSIFTGPHGRPYLQAGGNETVGQGWLHVKEVG